MLDVVQSLANKRNLLLMGKQTGSSLVTCEDLHVRHQCKVAADDKVQCGRNPKP